MTKTAIANRSEATARQIAGRSGILPGVDGRTSAARRYRDLVLALEDEQVAPLTTSRRLQIQAAASLQLQVEDMTARLARGEDLSPSALSRAVNSANRALAAVRPKEPTRREQRGQALTAYLQGRQPSPEAA